MIDHDLISKSVPSGLCSYSCNLCFLFARTAQTAGGLGICHERLCSMPWCYIVQKQIHDVTSKFVPSGLSRYSCSCCFLFAWTAQTAGGFSIWHQRLSSMPWYYIVQKHIHDVTSKPVPSGLCKYSCSYCFLLAWTCTDSTWIQYLPSEIVQHALVLHSTDDRPEM